LAREQKLIVDTALEIFSQTNEDVWVRDGGLLRMHGQLNGHTTVDVGGVLEQHGQVNGDIHCHGRVVLFGQVNGEVLAYPESDFRIAEGVMVGSEMQRFVTPDGTFANVPTTGVFSTVVGEKMWRLLPDGTLSPG
jgi:hypothetical protein